MSDFKVSDVYVGQWVSGFRAAIYDKDQGGPEATGNMSAKLKAFLGEEVNDLSEKRNKAYQRGYQWGMQFKGMYQVAPQLFPDLENALRGSSRVEAALDEFGEGVMDFVDDPMGVVFDDDDEDETDLFDW